MPRRPSRDPNEAAFNLVQTVIAKSESRGGKNPAAVALGRLGGAKGGQERARRLTAAERTQIARKAAKIRWSKRPPAGGRQGP